MVSKAQKKLQKKKAKEREDHKKILANREKLRASAREERKDRRRDKRIKKLQREMGDLDVWADDVYKELPDKTLTQLEHNAKILRVLEDEHEQEMAAKKKLNEDLEAKGHQTMDEKLEAMQKVTLNEQMGVGGSADYAVSSKPKIITAPRPRKDVAEVELIKRPDPDEN